MEDGILTSTKKVLGLDSEYSAFDFDIMTHINAAFSVLHQLGVGPDEPYMISTLGDNWSDFAAPVEQLNLIRTYIFLKVRMLFDPPTTSFLLKAMEDQLREYEWRISAFREEDAWIAAKAAEETI